VKIFVKSEWSDLLRLNRRELVAKIVRLQAEVTQNKATENRVRTLEDAIREELKHHESCYDDHGHTHFTPHCHLCKYRSFACRVEPLRKALEESRDQEAS
jgi:hypothetical protein